MADETTAERPYRDTLTVPSVLVMPGDPEPTEFHARCRDVVRIPVRIVWRDDPARENGGGTARPAPVRDGAPLRGADPAPTAEPVEEENAPSAATPPAPGTRPSSGDSVGAFLQVNDALDRAAGRQAPEPGTPQFDADGKLVDPNTPVPFVDDEGQPVTESLAMQNAFAIEPNKASRPSRS